MSTNIEWLKLLKKMTEKLKEIASTLKAVKVESKKTIYTMGIEVPNWRYHRCNSLDFICIFRKVVLRVVRVLTAPI